jgi:hypothetical protein
MVDAAMYSAKRYGVNGALTKCHSKIPYGIYAGADAKEICRFDSCLPDCDE